MKIWTLFAILLFSTLTLGFSKKELSLAKREMVSLSISNYHGSCPCPYSVMVNGRSCGRRSAYSRPGGKSPLCFEGDISDEAALKFLKKESLR